jgi:hypothetical protein
LTEAKEYPPLNELIYFGDELVDISAIGMSLILLSLEKEHNRML